MSNDRLDNLQILIFAVALLIFSFAMLYFFLQAEAAYWLGGKLNNYCDWVSSLIN